MPSLLDAIEAKYGSEDQEEISEAPIGIYVPRVGPRKSIPRLLILNDCDVDSAGEEENLEKTCSGVLEIDLAHNRLNEWSEISKILQYSPSVTFLNLSFNDLSSQLRAACTQNSFNFPYLPCLNTLILIGTKISWDSVWFLLRRATGLAELHLSLNDFQTVTLETHIAKSRERRERIDSGLGASASSSPAEGAHAEFEFGSPAGSDSGNGSSSNNSSDDEMTSLETPSSSTSFPQVRLLMFDGNPVSDWTEIGLLGHCFPGLRHLALSDCPISTISREACTNFQALESLSLSNTQISQLADLEALNSFPELKELRVVGVPALTEMTAFERRQLLVALLPRIKKINGGAPITSAEREDAERAFIRKYNNNLTSSSDSPGPGVPLPQRYEELVLVHGKLAPLIDFDLKPASRVKIRIVYESLFLDRVLNVYQTTSELKTMLEPLIGVPSSQIRLFYIDPALQGIFGREEMKYPQKQLFSFNMRDGDEIHVELKPGSQTPVSAPTPGSSTSSATK